MRDWRVGWKVRGTPSIPYPSTSFISHRIRLYSTKNLKPLGTLRYHKSGCQAVEFARPVHADVTTHPKGDEDDDEDEEMTSEELEARGRWLAAGAKDHRVSLWALISFAKT